MNTCRIELTPVGADVVNNDYGTRTPCPDVVTAYRVAAIAGLAVSYVRSLPVSPLVSFAS